MFDKVFKPNASQEKVYNEAAKSIVKGMFIKFVRIQIVPCFIFKIPNYKNLP